VDRRPNRTRRLCLEDDVTRNALRCLLITVAVTLPGNAWTGTGQPRAVETGLLTALAFRSIGPANMSGRVVDLAVVEAEPATFYVATATGGLWKTTDNGVTFEPVFEKQAVHSIGAVTVSQSDPDIVWVGTGERANRQSSSWGDGVYKSTDAGRTWANMGLRESRHVGRIVLHPSNPDIVYVAAMGHLWGPNPERGLYKSVDGGKTWTNVLFVDEDTGVVDVAMDPSDPNTLYAASYQRRRQPFGFDGGGPGSGLYRSTDGGRTWTRLASRSASIPALGLGLPDGDWGRVGISIFRRDPRIVYVSIEQGVRYNASTAYEERRAGIYRSEDKGETWRHMSDWNPRPMYASQILVDPNDDQRIYMVNSYSFSDDGGATFTTPRQTLHGDDRIVWVDPRDSSHVMKGDDGGLGISYDRGLKWLYVTNLPVSQFYRLDVDMRTPFWICGGLQDNGGWCGPSATYSSQGILNEDWFRVTGGDGFGHRIDPSDYRTVYTSSQYLGLSRLDIETFDRVDIRPGDPRGHIAARRNWKTWGRPAAPEPVLGNAMEPANWDAPFILSPHDPRTIYAGTRHVWKSTDRGDSWTALGDPTTGIDRQTLAIMGRMPGQTTLSLDDGVPYYPTTTAIAESPLRRGLLYAGTDDGNLQVSMDDGRQWTNVAPNIPGLPARSWVSAVEASRFDEGTVYVAFDNHASDDYHNYLFRSPDYGRTWTSIAGNLPADRVVKAVHEDLRNPDLLFAGTEFGLYVSFDRGGHWVRLGANLPTVPVNDFVIHPRDHDLVLATHGRGIWILDNIQALEELTPKVLEAPAHLFVPEPARMVRFTNPKAHQGDMVFRGANPPAGAIIDYYLRDEGESPALAVYGADGALVRSLETTAARGVNRVVWDLRHAPFEGEGESQGPPDRRSSRLQGPLVVPGAYRIRLSVGGQTMEQTLSVDEDPRLRVTPAIRGSWTTTLLDLGARYASADTWVGRARSAVERLAKDPGATTARRAEAEDVLAAFTELRSRLRTLYDAISEHTGTVTADQQSQLEYYPRMLAELVARAEK
jgi:hypothetical protein